MSLVNLESNFANTSKNPIRPDTEGLEGSPWLKMFCGGCEGGRRDFPCWEKKGVVVEP